MIHGDTLSTFDCWIPIFSYINRFVSRLPSFFRRRFIFYVSRKIVPSEAFFKQKRKEKTMVFLSFLLFAASVSSHTHTRFIHGVSFRVLVKQKQSLRTITQYIQKHLSNIIILYESKNNNAKTQQDHEYK